MTKTSRLHFFPASLPDETLHSRVSRFHCMSGNLHDRYSLQDLFGSHTFAPTSNLPSHLLALCARLPEQMACSPDELLEEATLFPYFRPFLTAGQARSEEHTSELQSLMRISYAVFCLKKKRT